MKILSQSLLSVLLLSFLLVGCAADDDTIPDTPVNDLYMTGYDYFKDKNYEESAKFFDEIERQHPYSVWAPRAQIMAAYAYYSANKYDDAVLTLERFIQLHPGNRNIAYAYYLKGLCYYEQISDVNREQKMTEDALETFKELLYRYPDSIYVPDVTLKLKEIESHLAGKEMAVGRYYQKNREYIPAMNRFQNVLIDHPKSNQTAEALYRLASCYTSLGMHPQAQYMYGFLEQYYPKSFWTMQAKTMLEKYQPHTQQKVLQKPQPEVKPQVKPQVPVQPQPVRISKTAESDSYWDRMTDWVFDLF